MNQIVFRPQKKPKIKNEYYIGMSLHQIESLYLVLGLKIENGFLQTGEN